MVISFKNEVSLKVDVSSVESVVGQSLICFEFGKFAFLVVQEKIY